jgi:high-affinity Fe2+/Pb2+ permease
MERIPHEFAIGGVYMPPMLAAALFGAAIAMLVARLLNRYRLSRYFFYPPLLLVSMIVMFTVLVGLTVIPF